MPSGRVEPGETSADAARREALEEGGASLDGLDYIGCYRIAGREDVRWADCYAGGIASLGPIGAPEESKGRMLADLDELPTVYHLWNPLTRMVFEHSREVVARRR